MKTYLMTLHTVWMYWPGDDALEMQGAVDDHVQAENPEPLQELISAAGEKVGRENVRVVQVEVDWADICRVFDTPKVEGTVAAQQTGEPR